MILSTGLPLTGVELTQLIRRTCEHLGIAFSANRVYPTLADLDSDGTCNTSMEHLNAVGRNFGLRFRAMSGNFRDLIQSVNDSGPALMTSHGGESPDACDGESLLILQVLSRGRLCVHQRGTDHNISSRRLQKSLVRDPHQEYQWLLIQPMLAAENASRFHYQGGTESAPLRPFRRLVNLLQPEAKDVRTILIFSIIIGMLSLTLPLAVEAVVNTIAFGRYLQPLIVLSLIVLVFLGFRAGLNVLMTVVVEVMQRKLFVRTVEDLSYRLTRVPLATWKQYHGPELVNRFFDIVSVQKISSKLLLETLMLLLQTIIGLSVLAFYHPFLLGYDVGLLTMMTIVIWFLGRGAVTTAVQESKLKYETAAWLQEIVRHPSTFKFNGGQGFAINRADELTAQYINHRQTHFRIWIRQFSFAMIMQVIAATALLALGGYLVIDGQMTLGQLVAAELIVTVILGSFAKLGKDLESFYDLLASVDKLGKLFDLPIEPINKLQLANLEGASRLSIVNLTLSSNAEPATLQFKAATTCALYGATELERSHFIEVITGQSKPASGHVLLDDYRVDAIRLESLQCSLSLIREVEIFESSVDENIRMGRENVGSHQVNQIIKRLGLRETIARLPEGFDTPLKICGAPLSQGQAIRLVLARALTAKPGILIVDGLLDRLSDDDTRDVLEKLKAFKSDTTILVSTGRKAIVEWADSKVDLSGPTWTWSEA